MPVALVVDAAFSSTVGRADASGTWPSVAAGSLSILCISIEALLSNTDRSIDLMWYGHENDPSREFNRVSPSVNPVNRFFPDSPLLLVNVAVVAIALTA